MPCSMIFSEDGDIRVHHLQCGCSKSAWPRSRIVAPEASGHHRTHPAWSHPAVCLGALSKGRCRVPLNDPKIPGERAAEPWHALGYPLLCFGGRQPRFNEPGLWRRILCHNWKWWEVLHTFAEGWYCGASIRSFTWGGACGEWRTLELGHVVPGFIWLQFSGGELVAGKSHIFSPSHFRMFGCFAMIALWLVLKFDKSTISMGHGFNSHVSHSQRVYPI